jgi:arabinan endo-1,5-alpha-L-arabinosidase
MATPPLTIASNAEIVHLEYNGTVTSAPDEGSYQFWWPVDGVDYYYLFFSDGNCCSTPSAVDDSDAYKIMVCRSTSPTGGFVDADGVDCLNGGGKHLCHIGNSAFSDLTD